MALSQSAVSELLEAFRTGEGVDLIRESVRMVMQELIEAEATERIGAAKYERTESRVTERNGARDRLLATQAGDVELRIPKLRKGSFFPVILEPRRRIDQALYAVVMEAYVCGVSTRSVDDLVAALGIDSGISKSEVSRICAGLDEVVTAFRTRRLDHTEFPYVYLDATYLHVRNATSQVVSMAVVVATGITADGGREVLGLDVGDSEDEVFWRAFLTDLKKRGLTGVRLVISDQHAGLVAALKRSFQGAAHQRCRVHFARNLLALVPKPGSTDGRRPGGLVERAVTDGCPCGLEEWDFSTAPFDEARRASDRCNFLTRLERGRRCSTTRIWCRRRGWSRWWLWRSQPASRRWPASTCRCRPTRARTRD